MMNISMNIYVVRMVNLFNLA
ncbi:hypothetical protein F383_37690 [Gossypium arboreum]|uniref:Uncharacterized protein n=1 Tax=Gossypium arboreum TaxID=29729 RepID=A0A0B0MD77_GOSAR|nr:hypothetical protein F383_37690 [Gossypium arboreum]